MIALDNGDKVRGDASAATVVDYTVHGIVGSTITQLADGQLASSITDIYTAGAAVAVASIILVNTDTSARTVNLYLTPSGGTARRLIPKAVSLAAGYSLHFDGAKVSVLNTSGEIVYATAYSSHAAKHTDGTDDIQNATSGQKGVATAAQITKLDAIEAAADVTDATNVAAAGAVMDADFTAADEVMVGTGAGTHGQVTLAASQFLAKKAAGAVANVTATEARTILNVADGADVTGSNAPQAHKDLHDPEDGGDALDSAAAAEIAGVQAAGAGSAHSFARSDHAHQIQHAITDNHLVTVDGTTNQPVATDYAKFTASGLEGMAKAQILSDINVADGADVTGSNAPQAHKDSHDPNDGSDKLDCAASGSISEAANAEGTAHSFARSDHNHQHLAALHENAGGAEISVAGLSGLLADDQHVLDAEAVSAAEAAGLALASGKNIKVIQALTSDHTWSGITATMTAGAALTIGQAVYVGSADSKMELSDADATTSMPIIALATGTIAENATGEFLLLGFFRDDTWDWTIGGLLYASCTAGALTQTAPSGSGDQVQVIGIAISADIIYFNPSFELVEIS